MEDPSEALRRLDPSEESYSAQLFSLFGKPDNWIGGVKIGLRLLGDKRKVNV